MAVREVTGYKLDSPCSNHGEMFGLPPPGATQKHLWIHAASGLQVRLHFLNFKEIFFLRRLNVFGTRAAEMPFNL